MPEEKREIDYELIKRVIEESNLSTMDLISKIVELGNKGSCQSCHEGCVSCSPGCSAGPKTSRVLDQLIIYPHEWERLKKEIIAELKG